MTDENQPNESTELRETYTVPTNYPLTISPQQPEVDYTNWYYTPPYDQEATLKDILQTLKSIETLLRERLPVRENVRELE